ncbi:MAG: c-type cytochrome [Flavobacteriales bacterium]|nr:c-type cytochrome [Flavobacteriales bacterium]
MLRKIFLVTALSVGLLSCGEVSPYTNEDGSINAEKIYKAHCAICHGDNGRKGFANSSILPESQLSEKERILVITNGRGTMSPYKMVLSEKEIEAVAKYTMTLK